MNPRQIIVHLGVFCDYAGHGVGLLRRFSRIDAKQRTAPFRGSQHTAKQLDGSGFSGTVGSQEAKNLSLIQGSTGMRQRLSLARALIHEPEILFLDEPTSGLDPESAQNVHAMIRSLAREKGITVFLCTHQL